jgi:hypothetical protein
MFWPLPGPGRWIASPDPELRKARHAAERIAAASSTLKAARTLIQPT